MIQTHRAAVHILTQTVWAQQSQVLGSTRPSEEPEGTSACSSGMSPSALTLHFPSPTQLYKPHMPVPLTKGSPLRPWSNIQGHFHSKGCGSAYCVMRPCQGMGQSQEKHGGWCCPSAQELHPWRAQGSHVAAPHRFCSGDTSASFMALP